MLRLLTGAAALSVLAAGAGFAAAVDVRATQEKAAALQRHVSVATTDSNTRPAAPPDSAPQPIPARMLGAGVPVPVSHSVLQARNGWLVSDGRTLIAVYAGAAGNDPSMGRLVIVRQDLVEGRQTVRTLDEEGTGPLTIVAAPLGSAVETSAQTTSIGVRAAVGRALTLDLGSSTLTRRSRSAATVPPRWPARSSDSTSYSFRR